MWQEACALRPATCQSFKLALIPTRLCIFATPPLGRVPVDRVMLGQAHQLLGLAEIGDDDAILALSRGERHIAVDDVVEHPLRLARKRIAIPAAAGWVELNLRLGRKPDH